MEETSNRVEGSASKSYTVTGTIELRPEEGAGGASVIITELPVRKWTQDYKEFLEAMMQGADKEGKAAPGVIKVGSGRG